MTAASHRPSLARTAKLVIARAASALGLLSPATDAYLYLRSRPWRRRGEVEQRHGGIPLPPPWLRFSSSGTDGTAWFLDSGEKAAALVTRLAAAVAERPAVLDYGCGCGRVLRHLDQLPASAIWGVDWNRRAIRWCSQHLGHARFAVGALAPPLAVPRGETFDLIYAFSVFTHMPEAQQRAWLEELAGRLRDGGVLAISTHGDAFSADLSADERRDYAAGNLVIRQPRAAGTNVCAAYHPPGSLGRLLPPGMIVEAHEPEGAVGNPPQDLWLLRRRHVSPG